MKGNRDSFTRHSGSSDKDTGLRARSQRLFAALGAFALMFGLPALALAAGDKAAVSELAKIKAQLETHTTNINTVWVLVAAALVFTMQAGFLVFEIGVVRMKNTMVTSMKNVGDWMVVSVAFFIIGFGLMFGETINGFIGSDLFLGSGIETAKGGAGGATSLGWSFVVFQLAFCGTAATIVSGAMAERTGFKAYLIFAFVMGALIYPVYGHWVWGGLYYGGGKDGWLFAMGYRDFAGSSVVHAVGAWASLVGIKIVGPRLGRYGTDGKLNKMECHSMAWSAFGTLLLWFGWWGFNGGSTLVAGKSVAPVIFNTNLAAAVAGITGFVHAGLFQRRENLEEKLLGSVLGGLVAITACCDVVTPMGALAVGFLAGIVHNVGFELIIKRWRIDDVVGAIPVHGFCGVLGVLSVGLFGQQSAIPLPRVSQIGVQALGALVSFAWTAGVSFVVFKVIKATVGIRVDPMREIQGLSLSPLEVEEEEGDELVDDVARMMADIRMHMDDERFDEF
jgi:Amt family ammonium transporter